MIGVDVRDDVAPAVIDDVFAWFARVDELFALIGRAVPIVVVGQHDRNDLHEAHGAAAPHARATIGFATTGPSRRRRAASATAVRSCTAAAGSTSSHIEGTERWTRAGLSRRRPQ